MFYLIMDYVNSRVCPGGVAPRCVLALTPGSRHHQKGKLKNLLSITDSFMLVQSSATPSSWSKTCEVRMEDWRNTLVSLDRVILGETQQVVLAVDNLA